MSKWENCFEYFNKVDALCHWVQLFLLATKLETTYVKVGIEASLRDGKRR